MQPCEQDRYAVASGLALACAASHVTSGSKCLVYVEAEQS